MAKNKNTKNSSGKSRYEQAEFRASFKVEAPQGIGELALVPVAIGNIGDISPRAVEYLSEADLILCEDTRVTGLLLSELGIKSRLLSCHEHNQISRIDEIIERIKKGEKLALVSDAGMPVISDPGAPVVDAVIAARLPLRSLPGPNAGLCALQASGISAESFLFLGFLPVKGRDRKEKLALAAEFPYTVIFYESPHKLKKTLAALADLVEPDRRICLAREMTKEYEEFLRMTIGEALEYYEDFNAKGEFVLILEGVKECEKRKKKEQA